MELMSDGHVEFSHSVCRWMGRSSAYCIGDISKWPSAPLSTVTGTWSWFCHGSRDRSGLWKGVKFESVMGIALGLQGCN